MSLTKLLLIDDEAPIQNMLQLLLRSKGYQVISADNGKKGLELFIQDQPSIVITDIKMPGKSGIEVLKEIKKSQIESEVIVMSGHGDMKLAIQALQLEASDFLIKPISKEALYVALDRANHKMATQKKLKMYTNDLETKVAEQVQELKAKYEFEANLIEHSINAIIASDRAGKIKVYNQSAEKIFGYSRDEIIGKKDFSSIYPRNIVSGNLERQTIENTNRNEKSGWRECLVLAKNGQKIPVRSSETTLYSNDANIGQVGFFYDLREIKNLEQDLIQAERLSATGQTIAGLAHYIKNILIGLEGGFYVVDKGFRKNDMDKLKNGWGMVKNNMNRVSSLVMDLLNYSKERKPECEICQPGVILHEVCELMETKAEKSGVNLMRNIDKNINEAFLDSKGIHRCLLNLVSNAIDACTVDKDTSKEHYVEIITFEGFNNTLIFQVSDNGTGMDALTQKTLFSSMFSTKGSKGTGLGLLITHKIVHEHKGSITVESDPGKGSKFLITLPINNK